jgi:hypothetical protein
MRMSAIILPIVLLIICTATVQAKIINVPGDSTTIQGGINGASVGDTVMVHPGTYEEHSISFIGKAITVMGIDPLDWSIVSTTIVQANGAGPVFVFENGEDTTSILAGLTITGGSRSHGGGIYGSISSPIVRNNIITTNHASQSGGGIFFEGSTLENNSRPILLDNIIKNNNASSAGAGFYGSSYTWPILKNNIIYENTAGGLGGGIACGGGTIQYPYEIINCTVYGNIANGSNAAGGIEVNAYSSSAIITNTIAWGNSFPDLNSSETTVVNYSNIGGDDPLFYNAILGDFHLQPGSPCIDTGDPSILDACRPPGLGAERSDMGAYGGESNCGWVELLFGPASFYDVGDGPFSVVNGDFNCDGNQDLAVANSQSDDVAILLGVGDGSFGTSSYYSVGDNPYSATIGDLNSDGNQDLAVANDYSNDVSILLGDGDGSFRTDSTYNVGDLPWWVADGDFDSDGNQDLAVANNGDDNLAILLGAGDGTFSEASYISVGNDPRSIAIGDFDSDGNQDLAVTNYYSDDIAILLGYGDGTFSTPFFYGVGSSSGPLSVAIGYFDSDRNQDLAVANTFSDNVAVLLGNGDGSFGPASFYNVGDFPRSVAVGDFDSDGNQDLVVANSLSDDVAILLGVGDGSFATSSYYNVSEYPSERPYSVTVGDFDLDGNKDLAVANIVGSKVAVLLNTNDPIDDICINLNYLGSPISGINCVLYYGNGIDENFDGIDDGVISSFGITDDSGNVYFKVPSRRDITILCSDASSLRGRGISFRMAVETRLDIIPGSYFEIEMELSSSEDYYSYYAEVITPLLLEMINFSEQSFFASVFDTPGESINENTIVDFGSYAYDLLRAVNANFYFMTFLIDEGVDVQSAIYGRPQSPLDIVFNYVDMVTRAYEILGMLEVVPIKGPAVGFMIEPCVFFAEPIAELTNYNFCARVPEGYPYSPPGASVMSSSVDQLMVDSFGNAVGSYYENGRFIRDLYEIPGLLYSGHSSHPNIIYNLEGNVLEGIEKVVLNPRETGIYSHNYQIPSVSTVVLHTTEDAFNDLNPDSISSSDFPDSTGAPFADAGVDSLEVSEGEPVLMDGSNSYDPDGGDLFFKWFEDDLMLSDQASFTRVFQPGIHFVSLEVLDEEGFTSFDDALIVVQGVPQASGVINISILDSLSLMFIPNATVVFSDSLINSVVSNDIGLVHIELPIGEYDITVEKEGYDDQFRSFTIQEDQLESIQIDMPPITGSISGIVSFDLGTPVSSAVVHYEGIESGLVTTNTAGYYEINNISPGLYTIYSTYLETASRDTLGVEVFSGELLSDVDFVIRSVFIRDAQKSEEHYINY